MLSHLVPRRLVPTLVAAGLTVALSTALVAAEAGPSAPNDHANPAAVTAMNDDHGKPETAGQPADTGAQGQTHRANHGQRGGTDDGSGDGTGDDSSDDTTSGGTTNGGSAGGAGQPADPGSQGQAHHDNQGQTGGNSDNTNPNASNGRGHNNEQENEQEDENEDGHDCKAPWESHGEFVSCVARGLANVAGASAQDDEHHGEVVREAAHSDTGKSGDTTTTSSQGKGSNHGDANSQSHGRGHKTNR